MIALEFVLISVFSRKCKLKRALENLLESASLPTLFDFYVSNKKKE